MPKTKSIGNIIKYKRYLEEEKSRQTQLQLSRIPLILKLPLDLQVNILSRLPKRTVILFVVYPELIGAVSNVLGTGITILPRSKWTDIIPHVQNEYKGIPHLIFLQRCNPLRKFNYEEIYGFSNDGHQLSSVNRYYLKDDEFEIGTFEFELLNRYFGLGSLKLESIHIYSKCEFSEVELLIKSAKRVSVDWGFLSDRKAITMNVHLRSKIKTIKGKRVVNLSKTFLNKLRVNEMELSVYPTNASKTRSLVTRIVETCKSLKKVHTTVERQTVFEALSHLRETPKYREDLKLTWDLNIRRIDSNTIDDLSEFLNTNRTVSSNIVSFDGTFVSDAFLRHVQLSRINVTLIFEHCINLKSLTLTAMVTDCVPFLFFDCNVLKSLNSLKLIKFQVAKGTLLLEKCKSLQSLEFQKCDFIGGRLHDPFADPTPATEQTERIFNIPSKIQHLTLYKCHVDFDAFSVFPTSLKSLSILQCSHDLHSIPLNEDNHLFEINTAKYEDLKKELSSGLFGSDVVYQYLTMDEQQLFSKRWHKLDELPQIVSDDDDLPTESQLASRKRKRRHGVQSTGISSLEEQDDDDSLKDSLNRLEVSSGLPSCYNILDYALDRQIPRDPYFVPPNDRPFLRGCDALLTDDCEVIESTTTLKEAFEMINYNEELEELRLMRFGIYLEGDTSPLVPKNLFTTAYPYLTDLKITVKSYLELPDLSKLPNLESLTLAMHCMYTTETDNPDMVLDLSQSGLEKSSILSIDLTIIYPLNIAKVIFPESLNILKLALIYEPEVLYAGFLIKSNFSHLKKRVNRDLKLYYKRLTLFTVDDWIDRRSKDADELYLERKLYR
ncbi:hypothetical protein CANARDRAFT_149856 [[Candida] arabinofermentans NRRL YB-2248]|uniref:F-box domain-containing protein n=1 Tax=[Candida] arabinofermentans NRRL YB-2248 TaxID=983967 RepID=A0A1E4T2U7_9ASCO|nr:hypothetical protein CANARDRAFT_149856 [[Candida] arabinofermentans NRRL YB-2248]